MDGSIACTARRASGDLRGSFGPEPTHVRADGEQTRRSARVSGFDPVGTEGLPFQEDGAPLLQVQGDAVERDGQNRVMQTKSTPRNHPS